MEDMLKKFDELRVALSEVEPDLVKSTRGVAAAGPRVRKGLKVVKALAHELRVLSITLDKARREEKLKLAAANPKPKRPSPFKKKASLENIAVK